MFAKYVYDAWGNVLHVLNSSGNEITSTTNLANQNPFRYRGYYFDSESGLYYLQSRYYDPVTGRFLNADNLIDGRSISAINVFSYCANNPINNSDPSGHLLIGALVSAAVGAFTGGLSAAIQGKSIVAGAVTGLLTGAAVGLILGSVAGTSVACATLGIVAAGAVAAGGNVANQYWNYKLECSSRSKHTQKSNYNNKTASKTNVSQERDKRTSVPTKQYSSFSEYVDKKSVAVSAITTIAFAPLSIGANSIVNNCLNGIESVFYKGTTEAIASLALGGNLSVVQFTVEIMIGG